MRTRRVWVLVAMIGALALLVVACAGGQATTVSKNADGYVDISADQLADMLNEKDITLVNTHIPYDGEIPETDLFIPFDDVPGHLDQLPDKDAKIVLYCRSGNMSTSAAKELVSLGYTNISEVNGGMRAWEEAGHELIRQ